MGHPRTSRYALLIGIDFYPYLRGNSLRGCVNDVTAIHQFISSNFGHHDTTVLKSPFPDANGYPIFDRNARGCPTFDRIRSAFETIKQKTRKDDFFYFHYSGHGAPLNHPGYKGACLLPADYQASLPGIGNVIPGDQLNKWLQYLHDKGVHVVVTLDSCYSGASWRSTDDEDVPRSPINVDWDSIPPMPVDEEAAEILQLEHGNGLLDPEDDSRGTNIPIAWGIKPRNMSILTACQDDQKAGEVYVDMRTTDAHGRPVREKHGAFTASLLRHLELHGTKDAMLTYHKIRDHLQPAIRALINPDRLQNPGAHGDTRLCFFKNTEPRRTPSVTAEFCNGGTIVRLPIGRVHGVEPGAEFKTLDGRVKFVIDWVDDLTCRSMVFAPRAVSTQQNPVFEVLPSRWKFGRTLDVSIDRDLAAMFQPLCADVHNYLEREYVCDEVRVQIVAGARPPASTYSLRLERHAGGSGIRIHGPREVLGDDNRLLRGLNLPVFSNPPRLGRWCTKDAASAIAHVARFEQVLNLRLRARRDHGLHFTKTPTSTRQQPLNENSEIRLEFENRSGRSLYFALLDLTSGLRVSELYNGAEEQQPLLPGRFWSNDPDGRNPWTADIDPELKGEGNSTIHSVHRDILRLIATEHPMSWKCMEMGSVWEICHPETDFANGNSDSRAIGFGRQTAEPMLQPPRPFAWWIVDFERYTRQTKPKIVVNALTSNSRSSTWQVSTSRGRSATTPTPTPFSPSRHIHTAAPESRLLKLS